MAGFRPTIPASVPAVAAGEQGTSDVTAAVATDPSQLDKNPDARSAAAQAAAAGQALPGATAPAAPDQPPQIPVVLTRQNVDINSASEAELLKLPGINKVTAQRIMMARPFLSLNDLIRIGLSKKTIDRLKPDATSSPTPPAKTGTK